MDPFAAFIFQLVAPVFLGAFVVVVLVAFGAIFGGWLAGLLIGEA